MSSCRAQGMPTMQRSWASLTVTVHLPQRCKMGPTYSCNNTQSFVAHITSPFLQVRGNEKHLQSKQMGDMLGNVRLSQQEANFPVLCTSILGRSTATSKPVGLSWGSKEQKGDVEGADRWRELPGNLPDTRLGDSGHRMCPRTWCMSCESRWWPALLLIYVSRCSKGGQSPWLPYTWINTHQEKNNPSLPSHSLI